MLHHAALQSWSAQAFLPHFLGLSFSLYRMGRIRCPHRSTLGQTSRATFGEWPISKHSCHRHC